MADTVFGRRFNHEAMAALGEAAPEWWVDLLRQWRAPGSGGDEPGALRLAVRNGTLNFYRRGQSVAQVGFGRGGAPYARVHEKYCRRSETGSDYLRCDASWSERESAFFSTVGEWTVCADRHADHEKKFVEQVVAADPNVVDLEIGLPGNEPSREGGKRRSLRIDLAVLDREGAGWKLVFWEVKLKQDGRLVASEGNEPKVFKQTEEHNGFLGANAERLHTAYIEACKVQVALAEQARRVGNPIILSDAIRAVAGGAALSVEPFVGLLVQDTLGGRNEAAWQDHREKLAKHFDTRLRWMTEAERLSTDG